jgi:hypothetical protein
LAVIDLPVPVGPTRPCWARGVVVSGGSDRVDNMWKQDASSATTCFGLVRLPYRLPVDP